MNTKGVYACCTLDLIPTDPDVKDSACCCVAIDGP